MTSPTRSPRILGLFTELLGIGGVQEASRQAVAAISHLAANRGASASYLSLNDPAGRHEVVVRGQSIPLRGFGRAKIGFVLSTLAESRNSVRVIFAAHPNLAQPAALAKRFSPRIRTVVVTHGVEVWEPLPVARRKALLSADLILAPSTYTAHKLTEVQGVAREKIHILPWPLDPAFLALADNPSSLPPTPQFGAGPSILTVGRWAAAEQYKGADQVIRAVSILKRSFPTISLVVVGTGDDLPRLKKIADELHVASSVHFLENLSREQVAACYFRCDVFALPSTGEGFGFVFLEAMAFAKPIVGVAKGGTIDLIRDGVNGALLPSSDFEPLAHSLERLLLMPQLCEELGRNGAAAVRRQYSVDAFERNLAATLAPLLS